MSSFRCVSFLLAFQLFFSDLRVKKRFIFILFSYKEVKLSTIFHFLRVMSTSMMSLSSIEILSLLGAWGTANLFPISN